MATGPLALVVGWTDTRQVGEITGWENAAEEKLKERQTTKLCLWLPLFYDLIDRQDISALEG